MDTRKMATELRMRHWSEILHKRKESGLSVRRWCQESGVNEKTYYYWQRKLRENTCEALIRQQETAIAPIPAFAEVKLPNENACKDLIIVQLGDTEVRIGGNASPMAIEAVLRVLRESC